MIDLDELQELAWSDWIERNGEVIDRAEGVVLLLARVRELEGERDAALAALADAQGAAPQAEAYDHCCNHLKCPGGSLCCCASEQRLRDCWNQWREEVAGDTKQAFRDAYSAGRNDPAPWAVAPVLPSSTVDEDELAKLIHRASCGPECKDDAPMRMDYRVARAVAAWLKDGAR